MLQGALARELPRRASSAAAARPRGAGRGAALLVLALAGGARRAAGSAAGECPSGAAPSERRRDVRAAAMEAYPGTAEERLSNAMERARSLTPEALSRDWSEVRVSLLWAAGLKDMRDVPPGMGNTGHCFADWNHCDATTMAGDVADNRNSGEVHSSIARGNFLGAGIAAASDPELGPGGSWCTCTNGCASDPPQDVAHVQFRSRIAWKLVWVPGPDGAHSSLVLVDDDGAQLATGAPTGRLPPLQQRIANYEVVRGSKYAVAADALSAAPSADA